MLFSLCYKLFQNKSTIAVLKNCVVMVPDMLIYLVKGCNFNLKIKK